MASHAPELVEVDDSDDAAARQGQGRAVISPMDIELQIPVLMPNIENPYCHVYMSMDEYFDFSIGKRGLGPTCALAFWLDIVKDWKYGKKYKGELVDQRQLQILNLFEASVILKHMTLHKAALKLKEDLALLADNQRVMDQLRQCQADGDPVTAALAAADQDGCDDGEPICKVRRTMPLSNNDFESACTAAEDAILGLSNSSHLVSALSISEGAVAASSTSPEGIPSPESEEDTAHDDPGARE